MYLSARNGDGDGMELPVLSVCLFVSCWIIGLGECVWVVEGGVGVGCIWALIIEI